MTSFRSRKDGTHHPITPAKGVSLDSFVNLTSQGGGKTFGALAKSDTPDAERIAAYKEKMERKAEHYRELSSKKLGEAKRADDHARSIADMIPMGQPILVGHHSEGRHRRDLDSIHRNMDKAIELQDTSKYYAHKAELAEDPRGISSDDPEAIKKLQTQIDQLEKHRNYLKNEYEVILGVSDFKKGSEHWRKMYLESASRTIRDKKKRIEDLKKVAQIPAIDKTINNVRIFTDKDDNRLKLFFPGKPDEETRTALKRAGFHWSPYNQAWQRQISNAAIYAAESIIEPKQKTPDPQLIADRSSWTPATPEEIERNRLQAIRSRELQDEVSRLRREGQLT